MKIIISHDIDHINFTEHYKDLIVPKYIARGGIEFFKGKIKFKELLKRVFNIFKIRFNRVEELIKFNKDHEVNETYFLGVNNGLGLMYSQKKAKEMCDFLTKNNVDYGVHGIDFDEQNKINNEKLSFSEIAHLNSFGIRMHYLRNNENTFTYLSEANYLFDSTEFGLKAPYKIGNMWEFPVQIMDSYLLCDNKPIQTKSLAEAKAETIRLLNEGKAAGLSYFSILFHDIYFDDGFSTWKRWYVWLINYLKEERFEFVNYKTAVQELEKKVNA